jgi:hypothetical protein
VLSRARRLLKRQFISSSRSKPEARAQLSKLAREILGYLIKNPRASDSLVGIARWWILKQRIETMTADVKKALDELVELGVVIQTITPHSDPTYSLNRRKLKRIRSVLANAVEPKSHNGSK